MKKLFIATLIIAGSLVANSAYSQVRVEAQFGIFERDFPGYTYYTYPAWRGHYQDRWYYEHYRRRFHREHRHYFRGRDFDHQAWDRRNDRDRGRGWDRDRDHGRDRDNDRDRHDRRY